MIFIETHSKNGMIKNNTINNYNSENKIIKHHFQCSFYDKKPKENSNIYEINHGNNAKMTTKTSEKIDGQKQPEKFTIIYSTKNQLKKNYININDNHYEKYKKAQVKLNMNLNSSKKKYKDNLSDSIIFSAYNNSKINKKNQYSVGNSSRNTFFRNQEKDSFNSNSKQFLNKEIFFNNSYAINFDVDLGNDIKYINSLKNHQSNNKIEKEKEKKENIFERSINKFETEAKEERLKFNLNKKFDRVKIRRLSESNSESGNKAENIYFNLGMLSGIHNPITPLKNKNKKILKISRIEEQYQNKKMDKLKKDKKLGKNNEIKNEIYSIQQKKDNKLKRPKINDNIKIKKNMNNCMEENSNCLSDIKNNISNKIEELIKEDKRIKDENKIYEEKINNLQKLINLNKKNEIAKDKKINELMNDLGKKNQEIIMIKNEFSRKEKLFIKNENDKKMELMKKDNEINNLRKELEEHNNLIEELINAKENDNLKIENQNLKKKENEYNEKIKELENIIKQNEKYYEKNIINMEKKYNENISKIQKENYEYIKKNEELIKQLDEKIKFNDENVKNFEKKENKYIEHINNLEKEKKDLIIKLDSLNKNNERIMVNLNIEKKIDSKKKENG